MKSRCLLISLLLIALATCCGAAESATTDPEAIYFNAKAAYKSNDCEATIDLLKQYLTMANPKPKPERLDSIHAVIGWCSVYLREGFTYHSISGIIGPNREWKEENAFGREMRQRKQMLLNK